MWERLRFTFLASFSAFILSFSSFFLRSIDSFFLLSAFSSAKLSRRNLINFLHPWRQLSWSTYCCYCCCCCCCWWRCCCRRLMRREENCGWKSSSVVYRYLPRCLRQSPPSRWSPSRRCHCCLRHLHSDYYPLPCHYPNQLHLAASYPWALRRHSWAASSSRWSGKFWRRQL